MGDAEQIKDTFYFTFPLSPWASSFLLFSRSDEDTHSMLSTVVTSRSVSSDNANLFFAAERPNTYMRGDSCCFYFVLYSVQYI